MVVESGFSRIASFQLLPQRFAAAVDVGLYLCQRDTQRAGDLLVAGFLEVKEHERDPLVLGELLERPLEPCPVIRAFEVAGR
jgi:hypothetical protein